MQGITLEQLLESRDRRAAHQRSLLEAWPACTLLCLTVQLPGSVKRNEWSLAVAKAGVKAVREAFELEYEELLDLETGFEAYFLLPMDPLEAKRKTCRIEDTHPLGRLMDIDVLSAVGTVAGSASANNNADATAEPATAPVLASAGAGGIANPTHADAVPVGREEIGLPQRRCLLCGEPARVCIRTRAHTREELLAKIEEMVNSYLKL